ncbi:hypothetical protein J6590_088461 [Homalodisca vitripennis]|nr:hypothetical protein J6590_088461 [Homalodisca vitripennis]
MNNRHLNEDIIEDALRSDADLSERLENLTDSSDFVVSSESDEFVHDSDADRDVIPDQPSTSQGRRFSPSRIFSSSSSERDDNEPPRRKSKGRPMVDKVRGRGRGRPRVVTMPVPINPEAEMSDFGDGNDKNDLVWKEIYENSDSPPSHLFSFSELPGPKHYPPPNARPIDYFCLFFTTAFLQTIMKETNIYAQQYTNDNEISVTNNIRNCTKGHKSSVRRLTLNWSLVTVYFLTEQAETRQTGYVCSKL